MSGFFPEKPGFRNGFEMGCTGKFHPVFLLPVNEISHSVSTVFPNRSIDAIIQPYICQYVGQYRLAGKTTLVSFVSKSFPLEIPY